MPLVASALAAHRAGLQARAPRPASSFGRDAVDPGHRNSGQDVPDAVAAQSAGLESTSFTWKRTPSRRTRTSSARTSAPSLSPKVIVRPGMRRRETATTRIVGIQDRDAVRRQRLDQFALRRGDAFDGFEEFDVRVADIRHHADARPGDRAPGRGSRPRDSCRFRAPPLRASSGSRRIESGTPTWLLKLPMVLPTGMLHGEQRRDHVLGGGLAGASGDADHFAGPADRAPRRPAAGAPASESGTDQHRPRRGAFARSPRPRLCASASFDVLVAVVIRSAQREEQVAGLQRARVDALAGDPGIARMVELPARARDLLHSKLHADSHARYRFHNPSSAERRAPPRDRRKGWSRSFKT